MPDYKDRSFSSEDTAELWENGCSTHIRTSDDLILFSPMPVSTARITLTAKTLLDEHSQEIKLFLERALKS